LEDKKDFIIESFNSNKLKFGEIYSLDFFKPFERDLKLNKII